MVGVMEELLHLHGEGRPDHKARFARLLQAIAPKLPLVPVTRGKQPLQWTTFTLNSHGRRFDAVRFVSPLDKPADLRWCFVVEEKRCAPVWYIHPVQGELQSGFETYQHDANVDLGVEGVPDKNLVFLQPLDGGVIQPGGNYILWFAFPETDKPVRMQIAIRLETQGAFPKPKTLEQLARDLGLSTPLKHTTAESTAASVKEIRQRYQSRDLSTALQLAERARQRMPGDRQFLLFAGYLNLVRGRQRAANYGPEQGAVHFLAASQHFRQFRDRYRERTEVENLWLGEALYSEAECLARMNEREKAVAALREALACGFDAAQIKSENLTPTITGTEIEAIIAGFRAK
jgi:hypothetical protein